MDQWQTRRITLAYGVGLALIALAATTVWVSTLVLIDAQDRVAVEINVAGRQRMLSQKIALHAEIISLSQGSAGIERAAGSDGKTGLEGCADLFLRAHAAMISRDHDLLRESANEGVECTPGAAPDIAVGEMSADLFSAYFDGEPSLNSMIEEFASVSKIIEGGTIPSKSARDRLLSLSENDLTVRLDKLVRLLQKEGENQIEQVQLLKTWLWVGTLVLLLLEVLFIFRPLARQTQRNFIALRESLRKSQKREATLRKLQRSFDSRGQFLAHMSHELRTPLNAIIGFADFLSPENESVVRVEKRREYVSDIKSAGEHLLSLVNDVLDLSRIDMNALEPVPEDVDLRKMVLDAVDMIRPLASEKSLIIGTVAGIEKIPYRTDPKLLRQILLNVLSNAVKYNSERGGIRVVLRKESVVEEGGEPVSRYSISVSDTGVGMSEEALATVYEPFGLALKNPTIASGGVGIGLPLSASIAELLGGTFEVTSREGRGTTVVLQLPTRSIFHT